MKALETAYAGCQFRSRLEARWAVFFDALDIPWSYELEGYELPSGRYLPDFWLPELDAWYEVKGQQPTDRERQLAEELAKSSAKNVYIAYGDIPFTDQYWGTPDDSALKYSANDGYEDIRYAWCVCGRCGKFGIEFEGRSERICRHDVNDRGHNANHPVLVKAFTTARSERFGT